MLAAFGRSTFTDCVITGMVIRKMMSMTSITSTSGVVLISDIGFSSASVSPEDTFMLMVRPVSSGYE